MPYWLAVDADIAGLCFWCDSVATDLSILHVWRVEELVLGDRARHGDRREPTNIATNCDQIADTVIRQSSWKEGHVCGHDGHIAAVEVAKVVEWCF